MTALEQDFSHLKDVLGTLPMVKRYIVLSIFFSLGESASIPETTFFLQQSLARLAKAFPHLTGQIVYEGRDESKGHSGVPKVVSLWSEIQLIVKDLRHDASFPGLSEISSARYPFTMLDSAILAPAIAVSWASDIEDKTAPYLIFQANFIRGGLILTISGNHTQMDMTGMGLIISSFAKACRNEPFTDEELEQGNQSRSNAIPLLDSSYQPGPELDDIMAKPPSPNATDPLSTKPRWAYFHFSALSLKTLKSLASKQTITPYISTDDAVAALSWQRLTAVRSRTSTTGTGNSTSTSTSTFARPFSVRKWLNLHGYTGHTADVVYTTLPMVHKRPLGDTAGHLRQALTHDEQITHHIRAYATVLARATDKSRIVNGANLDPTRDMVLSSYANIKCCDLSFGALGRPLAARRPNMPVWPGLCYLMPKDADGGIAVGLCVGEKDLEGLKGDEVLKEFAEFVG